MGPPLDPLGRSLEGLIAFPENGGWGTKLAFDEGDALTVDEVEIKLKERERGSTPSV